GSAQTDVFAFDFAVARLNDFGGLDADFTGDGKQTIDFGGADGASAVALDGFGRIVLAGSRSLISASGFQTDFAVARLDSHGVLDPNLDGKQTVSFDLGGDNSDSANALVLQPDGKILLAGTAIRSSTASDMAFARLDASGSPDPNFDSDGKQT